MAIAKELVATVLIGDAILGIARPRRHVARWQVGPWAPAMALAGQRPVLTRALAGAEVPEWVGDIPDGKPLAIMCGGGYRSSVAGPPATRRDRTPERARPTDERRSACNSGRQAERSWSRRRSSALSRFTSSSSSRSCASPASAGTATTGSRVAPAET